MDEAKTIATNAIDNLSTMSSRNNASQSKGATTKMTSLLSSADENKYIDNSLWLFASDNIIRMIIQRIINHKAFTYSIDGIIILNSLFLIMETVDRLEEICTVTNIIFTIIYLIEFLMKIIAFGFVLGENTYLRDGWNCLDLLVVICCMLSLLPSISANLSALRVFRLIRPLKAISMFPNMRRFISGLMSSLVDISTVLLMMMFFFIIFSILGLSLWNERFGFKCRTSKTPSNGQLQLNMTLNNRLCGGTNKCNDNPDLCLSSIYYYRTEEYFLSDAYGHRKEEEIKGLNYGVTTFQNIFKSLLVVFIATTSEGWVMIMNIFMDGHNYYISLVYFVLCIIINYYFMLNLLVAVLLYNFEKVRMCDQILTSKKKIRYKQLRRFKMLYTAAFQEKLFLESAKTKYKRKYQLIQSVPKETKRQMDKLLSKSKTLKHFRCFEHVEPRFPYHYKFYPGYLCYMIYKQPFVQIFFYTCIVLNAILLAIERTGTSQLEYDIVEVFNIIILAIFTGELLLLLLGVGFCRFVKDATNIWDLLVIIMSYVEYALKYNLKHSDGSDNESAIAATSMISTFRTFRLLRIFKMFRIWPQFQNILICVKETVKRMLDYFLLLFIIWYTYALLGYTFFHKSLRFDPITDRYKPSSPSSVYNFDSFVDCLVTVWIIMIGDHWQNIFYDAMRSDRNNWFIVLLYFISLVVIGQIVLMNVLLAYLTDNYQKASQTLEKNIKVKEFIMSCYYQTYQLHQVEESAKDTTNQQRADLVFGVYLNKFKRKQLTNDGELICIEVNKIDFITNTVVQHIEFINQKKHHTKYMKEIYLDTLKSTMHKRAIEELEIDFYSFDIDYEKEAKMTKEIHFNSQGKGGDLRKDFRRSDNMRYEDLPRGYSAPGNEGMHFRQSNELFNLDESESIIYNHDLTNISEISNDDEDYHSNNCHSVMTRNNDDIIKKRSSNRRFSLLNGLNQDQGSVQKKQLLPFRQLNTVEYHQRRSIKIENNKEIDFSIESSKNINRIRIKRDSDVNVKKAESFKSDTLIESTLWERILDHCRYSSLFIFHRDWKITRLIRKLINRPEYNYTICALILANILILCFDNPWLKPGSGEQYAIAVFSYVFNIIFCLEGLARIITEGFFFRPKTEIRLSLKGKEITTFDEIMNEINNPNLSFQQDYSQLNEEDKMIMMQKAIKKISKQTAYIRNFYNIIDFFCIIIGIMDMSGLFRELRYLRALKVVGSIKPIRLIAKSRKLNLLIHCLKKSLPAIWHVFCLGLLFFFVFAILGLNLFKDKTKYFCDKGIGIDNEDDCISAFGHWVFYDENYSNLFYSMKTNFEIMMGDGWTSIMEMVAKKTKTNWSYLYFIVLIAFGNVLMLNLFVSVMIERFKGVKTVSNDYEQLTSPEKEWVNLQKIMMKYHPAQKMPLSFKKQKFKEKMHRFIFSKVFENGVTTLIFLSTISLMIQFEGSSKGYNIFLEVLNYIFTFLFNLEIIMKLYVIGRIYFASRWNIFDLIVIILCDIMVIINIISYANVVELHSLSALPIVLRLFRIFRIFRIFSTFTKLKALINTLLLIFPSVANVGLIIIILITIYGNIAMNIFGTVPYRFYINENNNFRSFLSSVQVLFQVITGEDWNVLMNEVAYHDCRDPLSSSFRSDYYCVTYNVTCYDEALVNYTSMTEHNYFSCGNDFSYAFFISFMILGPVFVMNLCIVMVVEGFSELISESEGVLTEEYMTKILSLWNDYDTKCKKMIQPHELVLLMKELSPPFGFNYDRLIISNPMMAYKQRHQYLLFKNYLENIYHSDEETKEIIFDDENFALNQQLPYAFEFKEFYMSKNMRFYTTDLEVIRLMNKYDCVSCEDNTNVKADKMSYSFNNILSEESQQGGHAKYNSLRLLHPQHKDHYVHYIDACIAISRLIVLKVYCNGSDTNLRRNMVNLYTKGDWANHFNFHIIKHLFVNHQNDEDDSYKSAQVLAKRMYQRVNEIFVKKAKALKLRKASKKKVTSTLRSSSSRSLIALFSERESKRTYNALTNDKDKDKDKEKSKSPLLQGRHLGNNKLLSKRRTIG